MYNYTSEALDQAKGTIISGATITSMIVNKKVDINVVSPKEFVETLVKEKESIVTDDSQLSIWVDQAIADNPKAIDDIKKGKMAAIGVLIGSVMKYSKGTADVKKVHDLLQKKLT